MKLAIEMEIFKSNRSFCNFYPTLPRTFVIVLKMSKRVPCKYPKWKLPSQMDHGLFVEITQIFYLKKINK